jgi:predicted nucleic acid-binding protein
MLVVDSSVAIKWVRSENERDLEAAEVLLDRHQAGELHLLAPSLLRIEVANALWKHGVSSDRIKRALKALGHLHLGIVEPDAELMDRAVDLAAAHSLTVYDALFAALAESRNCELVTADKKLARSGACNVRMLGAAR